MRRIDLNMDEQKKYEVVKRLVDEGGNKNRAELSLGITRRTSGRRKSESIYTKGIMLFQ